MGFLDSSETPHARVVFAMCFFIVAFYLLVSQDERNILFAPFKSGEGRASSIFLVAFLIIMVPVIASMSGWNLNPQKKTHLEKVVTVEGMVDPTTPPLDNTGHHFCAKYTSKPDELEKACNDFVTKSECLSTECCGWLAHRASSDHVNVKCVGSTDSKPIYKSDENGKRIDVIAFATRATDRLKAAAEGVEAGAKKVVHKVDGDIERKWNEAI